MLFLSHWLYYLDRSSWDEVLGVSFNLVFWSCKRHCICFSKFFSDEWINKKDDPHDATGLDVFMEHLLNLIKGDLNQIWLLMHWHFHANIDSLYVFMMHSLQIISCECYICFFSCTDWFMIKWERIGWSFSFFWLLKMYNPVFHDLCHIWAPALACVFFRLRW